MTAENEADEDHASVTRRVLSVTPIIGRAGDIQPIKVLSAPDPRVCVQGRLVPSYGSTSDCYDNAAMGPANTCLVSVPL